MTKKEIVTSIHNDCNVRLQPSKVCDGVGVFAITLIKSGTHLFKDVMPDNIHIPFEELNDIKPNILTYLKSMCNCDTTGLYLSRTVNNINISYFINHSDEPNVEHDLTLDVYHTIKDIQPGDELLCRYTNAEFW
jgi:SET domain-containing protein